MVREELAKYLSQKTCPSCDGARLNAPARNVFVNELPIHDVTRFPIRQSLAFFDGLKLPGKRGEISVKIIKEIRERLEFLVNVGLDYLTLDRSADTLSGGEAHAHPAGQPNRGGGWSG